MGDASHMTISIKSNKNKGLICHKCNVQGLTNSN